MTIKRITLSYNDQEHLTVARGLASHAFDSDSAYIRAAIEWYERTKDDGPDPARILERLERIESILIRGDFVGEPEEESEGDQILDDLLLQAE